jgi:uncharacterized protein
MNQIDASLLAILVCPACRTTVRQESGWLVCERESCALRYPIREGIPIMLIDEAVRPPPLAAPRV